MTSIHETIATDVYRIPTLWANSGVARLNGVNVLIDTGSPRKGRSQARIRWKGHGH